MPKVIFTADPKLPHDWRHLPYRKGSVVDLSPDQCERWIRRGVARYLPPGGVAPAVIAAAPPAPEPGAAATEPSPGETPPAPEFVPAEPVPVDVPLDGRRGRRR